MASSVEPLRVPVRVPLRVIVDVPESNVAPEVPLFWQPRPYELLASPEQTELDTDSLVAFGSVVFVLGKRFAKTDHATFYLAKEFTAVEARAAVAGASSYPWLVRVVQAWNRKDLKGWQLLSSIPPHRNLITTHINRQEASLLMERCGGDLFSFLWERQDETPTCVAFGMGVEVISMVQYLHSHGIAHRDIKPENVVLSFDGILKLTDFDFATNKRIEHIKNYAGTLRYTPIQLWPLIRHMKQAKHQGNDPRPVHPPVVSHYDTFVVDNYALLISLLDILCRDAEFGSKSEPIPIEDIMKQLVVLGKMHGERLRSAVHMAFVSLTDEALQTVGVVLHELRSSTSTSAPRAPSSTK